MITLNVHIGVHPGTREELIEAGRVLIEQLAKESTFLDAWVHTTDEDPDLIVLLERIGMERKVSSLDTQYAWRS